MLVVLFRKSDSLCFVVVVSLSFVVVPLEDHLDEEGVVEGVDLPFEDDEVEDRAIEADRLVRDRFRGVHRRDHRVINQVDDALEGGRDSQLDDFLVGPLDVLDGLVLELNIPLVNP